MKTLKFIWVLIKFSIFIGIPILALLGYIYVFGSTACDSKMKNMNLSYEFNYPFCEIKLYDKEK